MYPKESLDIIGKMMNDTRRNVMLGSRIPLLVWGWTSFAVSLLVYLGLRFTANENWNFAWFLILAIGWPLVKSLKPKRLAVSTAISQSLVVIWKMLAVIIVVFSVTSFLTIFNVLAVILLILSMGSFITGELIRYPFLKYSSIAGFVLAILLWLIHGLMQIPVFAVAMLLIMVIPAYRMKYDLAREKDERA